MTRRPKHVGERLGAGAAIVLVPAVVLWARQTSRAELRVDSFGGAVGEVLFWSVPTIVCVLLLSRRPLILGGGGGATVVLALVWWGSARDWHSTASWRPALVGWFLLPVGLLILRFAQRRLDSGGTRRIVPSQS